MGALFTAAIVAGVVGALALFAGKPGSRVKQPSAVEFEAYVQQRAKEFLDGQDLNAFISLVPEDKQAEFSKKLVKFVQALVESSTATGMSLLLKIENIEKIEASVLETTSQTLRAATETLSRLNMVRDTIAAVEELSQKLNDNLRVTREIHDMSKMIRTNLNHATIQTVIIFAAGFVAGVLGNVLAARPYFSAVPTATLLLWVGLVMLLTVTTQVLFAVAARRSSSRIPTSSTRQ